jgi:ElaB/YqjD/DUF883 family membrane-anchored ribosome-binding protein
MDTTKDQDRRVEEAKQDFAARAEELGRRFRGMKERVQEIRHRVDDFRQRVNLGDKIARHPLASVGIAFGAGVLLGLLRSRRRVVVHEQPSIAQPAARGALGGALAAFALGVIRDFAMRRVSGVASDWIDRQREMSQQHEVESFVQH